MLQHFAYGLHRTITDLPREALQWQPDSEANNIGVTVWHICSALDLLKVKILENRSDQDQLWYRMGWASRTKYDPRGLGIGGFGNLSGYTLEQVKQVPILSAEEALNYFDQVYGAMNDHLTHMSIESLEQPPAGWPAAAGESPDSVYMVLIMFLMDIREHLGEIKAIKAMWKRKSDK